MTEKRDLKRRVRERQARTGESYMTALRHVTSQREPAFPVVEMVDFTEVGDALGLKCRILMAPELAARVDASATLVHLRTTLLATTRERALDLMRSVVLHGEAPVIERLVFEGMQFVERLRAGIGGFSESGRMLALTVEARQGFEMVLFTLWLSPVKYIRIPPTLLVMRPGEMMLNPTLAAMLR